MSQRLTSRDPALRRLRDEGFVIAVVGGYVVVRHVPYVTQQRTVEYGVLAFPASPSPDGDALLPPTDHTARFAGTTPCTRDGVPYEKIINASINETIEPGLVAQFMFSSKPQSGRYDDVHHQVTTYVAILEAEARVLVPEATARTFPVVLNDGSDDSPFTYVDSASSRAGINATNAAVKGQRIAIVGLGGTGSHILDLVAKTWVSEIHLFDDDLLHPHNAFRMPGVVTAGDLAAGGSKVAFLAARYGGFRKGVMGREDRVDERNVNDLAAMDFVFLALTDGAAKKVIVDSLEQHAVPFIDCGMGIYKVDNALGGQIRATTSTEDHREAARKHIPFSDGESDEYSANIQIAELNSLNATLAVIKWKKLYGYYSDLEHEYDTVYVIDGNKTINSTIDDSTEDEDAAHDPA